MKKIHQKEINRISKELEDRYAESLWEKEKEYALILDGRLIEHEDQLLDTENRLHREYIDKISKYQEVIKELKAENQDLYEENSLKQKNLDENTKIIQELKEKLRIQNLNFENYKNTQNFPINWYNNKEEPYKSEIIQLEQKQRPINVSGSYPHSIPSSNKENQVENNKNRKHPIDNLKGYWDKKKAK